MLIGEYSVQIGEKNRIAIPKKLREKLDGRLFLTRGYENCLILVDETRWTKLIEEINKKPLLSLSVRDTKRFILGGSIELEPDSQGRIVLPDSLKEFSAIDQKIIFLGVGEWAEVWAEERWKEKLNILKDNVSDLAETLG
ncbi:MAG: division/cell wall cluster transcriptional repressor MraZ [Candidatus Dojkabacteria bacterium]